MEECKKLIYDLMNGKLDFKDNPPEECKYVKDEFSMNSQREKCVNRHRQFASYRTLPKFFDGEPVCL